MMSVLRNPILVQVKESIGDYRCRGRFCRQYDVANKYEQNSFKSKSFQKIIFRIFFRSIWKAILLIGLWLHNDYTNSYFFFFIKRKLLSWKINFVFEWNSFKASVFTPINQRIL